MLEEKYYAGGPSVFERLQADTEKRMRMNLDCIASPRRFRLQSSTPILRDLIIANSKNNSFLASDVRSTSQLSFKPSINKRSQVIMRNKYLEKAKIDKTKCVLYDDEEYSNPAEIEEIQKIQTKTPEKIVNKPALNQQQFIKNEEKNIGNVSVTDRKYVPMFTKPFDIDKILKKPKDGQDKRTGKNNKKILGKTQPRPLLRPISDSNIHLQDSIVYKQIVDARGQKANEVRRK